MNKKKISLLFPSLITGGAEKVNVDLANEFFKRGYQVQIVLLQAEGELMKEVQNTISIIDLKCSRIRDLPLILFRYFREHRPKILIASMWPITVIAPIMKYISGCKCKIIICEHNTLSLQYHNRGWFHRVMLRTSIAIGYRLANIRLGVSKGVIKDLIRLSWMSEKKFDVIYNPINTNYDVSNSKLKEIEKLWSSPRGFRIVTVGSLKPQKNYHLLLRAFAKIDNPKARLMLVGTGNEYNSLILLSKELKISDKVIFAGFHRDPTPFYKTADLFVLSSDYEGFGNVIVEALAHGIPVVSTNCQSGPSEILKNGQFGKLVPVNNLNALVKAIKIELNSHINKELLMKRAKDFLPEVAAEKYISLINEKI
jgi:glycosyltransferase involved in cell wall biosynthesis